MDHGNQTEISEPLSAKLDRLANLLGRDVESVAAGASETLDSIPGQAQALLLLISALNVMGAEAGALEVLAWMSGEHPKLASLQYEFGLALARLGRAQEAVEALTRTVQREPGHPAAWRMLGNQLGLVGDIAGARRAHARSVKLSLKELKLIEGALAACRAEEFAQAENMLRQAQGISPTDVTINRLLGELYLRVGRLKDSELTLERATALAPACTATRVAYCLSLTQQKEWQKANTELRTLLRDNPDNLRFRSQLAANLAMLGEREEARRVFDALPTAEIEDSVFWLSYAQTARIIGTDEKIIIDATRASFGLDPSYGPAWWSLADLKTYRFSPDEIARMRDQLARDDIPDTLRYYIEFALGKALEDEGQYAQSFAHYERGNALRRAYVAYDPDEIRNNVSLIRRFFTPDFFAPRKNVGCQAADPIFIVGMARAGSTLIEQILSSHSQVEGTMELPDLRNVVGELIENHAHRKAFPDLLADFDSAALRRIGEDYLERTKCQRKLGRPFFTDKAGNNFLYVGLIQLILPNSKIIDARRHPMACAFSCFKQVFATGSLPHSYDQVEIARFYRDYVEAMAHYDRVLPGRVHRVIHEELVSNPEREIRRILAYCDLPFEEQCLHFYESDRSVRTSSSQQVRQPIRKKSAEPWRRYEPWLAPMKTALGDVLTRYPEVPEFG
jgi:Flp pilus assembly protein TadD